MKNEEKYKGQGTRDKGLSTKDKEQRTRNKGQGTKDKGLMKLEINKTLGMGCQAIAHGRQCYRVQQEWLSQEVEKE